MYYNSIIFYWVSINSATNLLNIIDTITLKTKESIYVYYSGIFLNHKLLFVPQIKISTYYISLYYRNVIINMLMNFQILLGFFSRAVSVICKFMYQSKHVLFIIFIYVVFKHIILNDCIKITDKFKHNKILAYVLNTVKSLGTPIF